MQHHTDIACRNPNRHLAIIGSPDEADDIRQSLLLNQLLERVFCLTVSYQQEPGGWDFVTHKCHCFDQRLQPMPGEKASDKPDIGPTGRKSEDGSCSLMRLRVEAVPVDSVTNDMTPLWGNFPSPLHLRHDLATDTHHRLHTVGSSFQCSAKHPSYERKPPNPLNLFLRQAVDKEYTRASMV